MEITLRPSFRIKLLPNQWLIYALIGLSMFYGFWFLFYHYKEYRPWEIRLIQAVEGTVAGHFGLWLATIRIKSKLRFIAAAILLPTVIGVSFLWLSLDLSAAIVAFGCMSWLMYRVITGK